MHADQIIQMARRIRVSVAAGVMLAAGICANAADVPQVPALSTNAPSEAARAADERFWSTLHGADYAAYPLALAAVEAALAQAPADPVQNAHLGWLHVWHLSEAGSFGAGPRDMRADLTAAGDYFKRAVELAPNEARYLGFYATTLYVESALASDPVLLRRAQTVMERAVRMWPEFNLFTAGYIHSSDSNDSPEYAAAMQRMWLNLDLCAGQRISRKNPRFASPLAEIIVGPKRACWNSSIAPHNFEGFFLNFGDMLVKTGDVAAARVMYTNARLSATYADWAYRDVLERRIEDAAANVAVFRDSAPSTNSDARMMVQSNFSCMACHRR